MMDHTRIARPEADREEYARPRLVEIGSVAGLTLAGSGSSSGRKTKPRAKPNARSMPKPKANARPTPKARQKKRTATLRAFD